MNQHQNKDQHQNSPDIDTSLQVSALENQNFNKIIANIDEEVQKISPKPFSPKAFQKLKQYISIYIVELISESVKNAKRENLDSVSGTHIDKAQKYLTSSNNLKTNKLYSSIGGVLLGATLSNVVNMVLRTGEITAPGVIITVLLGIFGSFLLAYNR